MHAKMHSPLLLIILSTDPLSIALCGSDALVKRTLPSGEEACNENTLAEGEGQSEKLASIALSDFRLQHLLIPSIQHPLHHLSLTFARHKHDVCVQNVYIYCIYIYSRNQKMHACRQIMPICKKRHVMQLCTIV